MEVDKTKTKNPARLFVSSPQSTVPQTLDNKVINEIQNYDYFYLRTYDRQLQQYALLFPLYITIFLLYFHIFNYWITV